MIIKNFSPFFGENCETTTIGNLLQPLGLDLTEALLFGIGQGLGFIYWDMKIMDFPFIGGRIKPDLITKNIAENLNLELNIQETSSLKKAWENVEKNIQNNTPVGLKLDCYYLDYFTKKIHFAAHYATLYGYDDTYAYLVDTKQQGNKVKVLLKNLTLARNAKGPMSSKNLSFTFHRKFKQKINLKSIIERSIQKNALDYLNPPIQNIGYKGIEKTSLEIRKWFQRSRNIELDLKLTATLMEHGGTGGSLFRKIYCDFLQQSLEILQNKHLEKPYSLFCKIAQSWTEISELIEQAAETQNQKFLDQASQLLLAVAQQEKLGMTLLAQTFSN